MLKDNDKTGFVKAKYFTTLYLLLLLLVKSCLMGVPTSEVGYTTAMPRREDHEVHKDMWWHLGGGTSC
jgi:hypothetical protein